MKAKRKKRFSNQAATNEALKSHKPGQCNVQMEAGQVEQFSEKNKCIQIRYKENKVKSS